MFQQPYLGKTVIYRLFATTTQPDTANAAIVTKVLETETDYRLDVNLAVLTGDPKEPVFQVDGVKYGAEGGQYGWTDAAR